MFNSLLLRAFPFVFPFVQDLRRVAGGTDLPQPSCDCTPSPIEDKATWPGPGALAALLQLQASYLLLESDRAVQFATVR
jgi:hypothetical protein